MAQLATQSDHLVKDVHSVNPTALIVGMGYGAPDTSYAAGNLFDQFGQRGVQSLGMIASGCCEFHGYPHGCCSSGGHPFLKL